MNHRVFALTNPPAVLADVSCEKEENRSVIAQAIPYSLIRTTTRATLRAYPFAEGVCGMNHVLTFNPLQFANRLKEAGIPDKQAEAEAEALREAFAQQAQAVFALEDKVKTLASDTRHDASGMATKGDIAGVKEEIVAVKDALTDVRSDVRVLKWMMGFVLAGIVSLMMKLFF